MRTPAEIQAELELVNTQRDELAAKARQLAAELRGVQAESQIETIMAGLSAEQRAALAKLAAKVRPGSA
jgi:DNA-binding MarR family transcriptional regulator